MAELPTGTVTLLFTDIEGSTRLLEELGRDVYVRSFSAHQRLLREAFTSHGGVEVELQGDSFHFAFKHAREAVGAAAEAQRGLAAHVWGGEPIRVRIGIHTGEPLVHEGLYAGLDVHRAARVMAAGHGGQVLLSDTTAEVVGDQLGEGLELRDLGEHRLRDLTLPQRLFQLLGEGLEAEFPPLKTLENRPTNLPTQPTPLIGRERELAQLGELLARDDVRLVTLTGPGGTGKTRLALQAAANFVDRYRQGVFLVTLAPVRDASLVLPTIAQTLGLRERPAEPLEKTLIDFLADRELLLVLDNFEQVIDAAADISHVLRSTTVLVTSREPLRLAGEHRFAVPPLELPDPAHLPHADALSQYEAVVLFAERARASRPEFQITSANAPAVAEICVRLDGLPLAIELAAARVAVLSPEALLARLGERFELLTGGARDADERQQTLRRAIEWSYDLLSSREQDLFARLGVFRGGFTLEAAEEVCGADLDTLQSLVEKSLVRRRDGRFELLETIREYALEQHATRGDADEQRRRHTDYFVTRIPSGQDVRSGKRDAFDFIDGELDNVRAAFDEVLAGERVGDARRLLTSLRFYWIVRGLLREGVSRAEQVMTEGACTSPDEARAQWDAAELFWALGDLDRAVALKEASLPFTDGAWKASTLADLAHLKLYQGRIDEARPLVDEAIRIRTEIGDQSGIGHARNALIHLNISLGDYRRALELEEEDLDLNRRESSFEVAGSLVSIGALRRRLGDFAAAATSLREGGELACEIGDVPRLAWAVEELAGLALEAGEPALALRALGAVAAARESTGVASFEPDDVERTRATAEDALSSAACDEARQEESGWSLEDAFERLLEKLDPQTSTTTTPSSTRTGNVSTGK
jgi:predicted ATPase/class 3 adenylate cyclase